MKRLGKFIIANLWFACYVLGVIFALFDIVASIALPFVMIFTDVNVDWCEYCILLVASLGAILAYAFSAEDVINSIKRMWSFKVVYPKKEEED